MRLRTAAATGRRPWPASPGPGPRPDGGHRTAATPSGRAVGSARRANSSNSCSCVPAIGRHVTPWGGVTLYDAQSQESHSRAVTPSERRHRAVGLPVRLHRGDPTVVVDDVDHDQVGRGVRPSANDVLIRPMLAQVLLPGLANDSLIVELERLDRLDRQLPERRDALVAAVALALRVEHRRADRVLEHRVLGVHRQPLGEVALGDRGVRALRGGPGRVGVVGRVPGDGVGRDHGGIARPKLEHVLGLEANPTSASSRHSRRVHHRATRLGHRWRHGQEAQGLPARRSRGRLLGREGAVHLPARAGRARRDGGSRERRRDVPGRDRDDAHPQGVGLQAARGRGHLGRHLPAHRSRPRARTTSCSASRCWRGRAASRSTSSSTSCPGSRSTSSWSRRRARTSPSPLERWGRAVRKPERLHVVEVSPGQGSDHVWRELGRTIGFGTAVAVAGRAPAAGGCEEAARSPQVRRLSLIG